MEIPTITEQKPRREFRHISYPLEAYSSFYYMSMRAMLLCYRSSGRYLHTRSNIIPIPSNKMVKDLWLRTSEYAKDLLEFSETMIKEKSDKTKIPTKLLLISIKRGVMK